MLEKIAGVAVVTKLRTIILMEADFNCHNRIIFGDTNKSTVKKGKLQRTLYCNKCWFMT